MYTVVITPQTQPRTIANFFTRIINTVWKLHDTTKYETARSVFEELVARTPVDTGRAAASWRAGVEGMVPSAGLDLSVKTPRSFEPAVFMAPRKVLRNQEYEISNDVPYLGFLNAGSSRQAPAGFIEQAIDAGMSKASLRLRGFRGDR